MLEKKSGTVGYAVVRCGGLLKGEVRHYPVPWDLLKYNVAREAYTTDVTLAELRSGPSELDGEAFDWATAPRSIAIRSIGRCRAANLPRVYATAGKDRVVMPASEYATGVKMPYGACAINCSGNLKGPPAVCSSGPPGSKFIGIKNYLSPGVLSLFPVRLRSGD
jgi:hypothetical protein